MKKKMLLHTCCAPCACYVVELLKDTYDITLFYFNPNIQPESEYLIRLNELKKYVKKNDIKLIIKEGKKYEKEWNEYIKGYESEPEGGFRCSLCYEYRIKKSAEYTNENGYNIFGTVLTISPHKKSKVINELGNKIGKDLNIQYFESDFKKKDGFKKSCILSKKYNFYRQTYCGCKMSISPSRK